MLSLLISLLPWPPQDLLSRPLTQRPLDRVNTVNGWLASAGNNPLSNRKPKTALPHTNSPLTCGYRGVKTPIITVCCKLSAGQIGHWLPKSLTGWLQCLPRRHRTAGQMSCHTRKEKAYSPFGRGGGEPLDRLPTLDLSHHRLALVNNNVLYS